MSDDDKLREKMGVWGPLLAPKISDKPKKSIVTIDPDKRFTRRRYSQDIPRDICVICKVNKVYKAPSAIAYKCRDCLREYNKKNYHENRKKQKDRR